MGLCLLAGWTERQFWFSTYRAVFNLINTMHRTNETRNRERWEQTRLICTYIAAQYRSKKDKGKPAFTLPWDDENKKPVELPKGEKLRKMKEKFARWDKQYKADWEAKQNKEVNGGK